MRAIGDAGPYGVFCNVDLSAGASPRPTVLQATRDRIRCGRRGKMAPGAGAIFYRLPYTIAAVMMAIL